MLGDVGGAKWPNMVELIDLKKEQIHPMLL